VGGISPDVRQRLGKCQGPLARGQQQLATPQKVVSRHYRMSAQMDGKHLIGLSKLGLPCPAA
jgi:hypothetical protein